MRGVPIPTCLAPGCEVACVSFLGLCAGHYERLPVELRKQWWNAWAIDCRVSAWTGARKAALEYLADRAP